MTTGLYKTIKGEKVELTAKQVKADIMQIRGWTSEEYQRQYDKLRNQLRAYEGFQRSAGATVEPQSPLKFLYTEAKAMQHYGANYKPSAHTAIVRATTSVSSGKALQKAIVSTVSRATQAAKVKGQIDYYFEQFIQTVPQAKEITQKIKDPLKQMEALKELAKKLHAREDAQRKVVAQQTAMPFGQVAGSRDEIGFNLSRWL